MPPKLQDRVPVACPHCGHQQPESRTGYSTVCKACGKHFQIQHALNPVAKVLERGPELRRVTCFDCGAELDVPASAESTMCKKCGRYQDLHNYQINAAVSKNFRTRGRFQVDPKGYVFNTDTVAVEAVIKGRFHGKLMAEQSLTVYSGAEIKGTFKTAKLIIPAENSFRWATDLQMEAADIAGEWVGNMQIAGTVTLRATARWFGDLVAKNVVMEEGAVMVGKLRIGEVAEKNLK